MPDFAHDEATVRRALDVIDQLLAARDRIASGVGGIVFLREHEAVAPVAWSWWMLISDSARLVAEAAKNDTGFVVAPVMRNLMTHAVALAWLVDGGEAAAQAVDLSTMPRGLGGTSEETRPKRSSARRSRSAPPTPTPRSSGSRTSSATPPI